MKKRQFKQIVNLIRIGDLIKITFLNEISKIFLVLGHIIINESSAVRGLIEYNILVFDTIERRSHCVYFYIKEKERNVSTCLSIEIISKVM